jgi:hypothetical protein
MARHRGRRGQGWQRGSGTTTGALPAALRPKAGSATGLARRGRGWCDGGTAGGVEAEGGDSAASREVAEAPREVASMARRRRGRKTWAA